MARVGPHVSRYHASGRDATIVGHIRGAFRVAEEEGFTPRAVQLFLMGPKDRTLLLKEGEADELKAFAEDTKTVVMAHSAYINSNPWKGNPVAAASIREELSACAEAGVHGLVCHLPVSLPHDWVLRFLPRLLAGRATRIYLEHVAGKGSLYHTVPQLADLFRGIRRRVDPTLQKVGFCVDTAHLWSCGVDISSYEKAEAWLNDLEAIGDVLPPDRVMIHLNDSVHALGSGKDQHAVLLEGTIWGKYKGAPAASGLAAFVDYAMRNDTIVILERKPAESLLPDYRTLLKLEPALGGAEA